VYSPLIINKKCNGQAGLIRAADAASVRTMAIGLRAHRAHYVALVSQYELHWSCISLLSLCGSLGSGRHTSGHLTHITWGIL